MSILFFHLRGVPQDEADDVRDLLSDHEIPFYETSAGVFGMSTPAIWLYQQADIDKIQPVFDDYQQQRAITQRQLYIESRQLQRFSFKRLLLRLFYLAISLSVIYISLRWLADIGFRL